MVQLEDLILTQTLTKEDYEEQVTKLQLKVRKSQLKCVKNNIPVILAFEGWDAAGKGGAIKRVTEKLDPRFYHVVPIAAPVGEEKTHHYLWRFWTKLPSAGYWTIFDRTWYGRVLVERIEHFCSDDDWHRALKSEINEFEESLSDYGIILCKFWIHISKDEQLKRFKERKDDEYKYWKLTDEDWRNSKKYDEYWSAMNDVLTYTNTKFATWNVIPGNNKYYARLKVLEIIANTVNTEVKAIKQGTRKRLLLKKISKHSLYLL